MRGPALALVALALLPGLAGCMDFLEGVTRPDYPVSRTPVATGTGAWNTDGVFVVQVDQAEPLQVRIEATPPNGAALVETGFSDLDTPVTMDVPDGTWTITYEVDGYEWETFRDARFDATPPTVAGLEAIGSAPAGSYLLGEGAVVEPGARLEVVEQSTGQQVASALPAQLVALADGVHTFDVVAADAAGNEAVYTVQVIVGSATQLPAGGFTMGIVARYSTSAALWDITDLDAYLTPAEAQEEMPGYLAPGQAIEPDDADVQRVVGQVVQPGMTTAEAALALYRWMFNNLEYDEARLGDDGLLTPSETMAAGGGVCRDLAALYVSLLRAADVPARLAAGYLGGRVGGFHAWVEFYGGAGHGPSPWVPVDVSGIDGPYEEIGMLQSFAIRLPEYLMLRAWTPEQEQDQWSSVMTVPPPRLPAGSRREPQIEFDQALTEVASSRKAMCVDEATGFRQFRDAPRQCTTPRGAHIPDFLTSSTRVLDYGIVVENAAAGTKITLEAVYPDRDDTTADHVDYQHYVPQRSASCSLQDDEGRVHCTMDA
jgi:hypothetical protein